MARVWSSWRQSRTVSLVAMICPRRRERKNLLFRADPHPPSQPIGKRSLPGKAENVECRPHDEVSRVAAVCNIVAGV
jgi:hypothetical protein